MSQQLPSPKSGRRVAKKKTKKKGRRRRKRPSGMKTAMRNSQMKQIARPPTPPPPPPVTATPTFQRGPRQTLTTSSIVELARAQVPTNHVEAAGIDSAEDWFDPRKFRRATRVTMHQRGQAQVAIDSYLKAYDKLTLLQRGGQEGEALLLQMAYACEQWILDHVVEDTDDSHVRRGREISERAAVPAPGRLAATRVQQLGQALGDAAPTMVTGVDGSYDYLIDPKRKKRLAGMILFHDVVRGRLAELDHTQRARLDLATMDVDTLTARHKKLVAKYEGGPTSTFAVLGKMIEAAVPKAGDTSELEVDFKWPVDPTGTAFIGGVLRLSASKDVSSLGTSQGNKQQVTARAELVFQAGGDVADVATLQGELGGYIEASGPNGPDCTMLMSYYLLRRTQESFIFPREITHKLWSGRTGRFGAIKTEMWSRKVERQLLSDADVNEDNYVDGGMTAGMSVSAGKKFGSGQSVELGAGLTFSRGTRYDPTSMTGSKQNRTAGDAHTRHKKAKWSATHAKIGRRSLTAGANFEFGVGPFGGSASLGMQWLSPRALGSGWAMKHERTNATTGQKEMVNNRPTLDSAVLEFTGSGKVANAGADAMGEKITGWIMEGLKTIAEKAKTIAEASEEDISQKTRIAGESWSSLFDGLDQLKNVSGIATALTPKPGDSGWLDTFSSPEKFTSFSGALGERETTSTIGLTVSFSVDLVGGAIAISLMMDKSRGFEIPKFLSVSTTKASRLFIIERKDKNADWTARW